MAPPEIDRTREESLSLSTDYADLCNQSFQASMTGHSFCCERARIKLRAACLSGGVREVARSLAQCFRLGRAAEGKLRRMLEPLPTGARFSGTVRRMPVNAIAMPFSFAAAIDSSSLIDPPRLETRVRLAQVSSPFGRGWVRVRSLNRKPDPGRLHCCIVEWAAASALESQNRS